MTPDLAEIKIEVTHRCNLNCIHCSSDGRPSNELEMAREDCLRIISEAVALHVKSITFSGGEPFLWPALLEVVSVAKKNQMKVSIYTTGHSEHFFKMIPELKQQGLDSLIFSLFGASASTHERITRKAGSFKLTQNSILHANTNGIDTQLHFVPTAKNYTELDSIFKLAKSLHISKISILRLVPQGRASLLRGQILTGEQNQNLRRTIIRLRELSPPQIRVGSPYNFLFLGQDTPCKAGVDKIIVGPNQHIFPCDAFKGIEAEDIVQTDRLSILSQCSLAECWETSPYLQTVRDSIQSEDMEPCKICSLYSQCKSGCLAQKFLHNRTLAKAPDPDCLMKRTEVF